MQQFLAPVVLLIGGSAAMAQVPDPMQQYREDFEYLVRVLGENYAYPESPSQISDAAARIRPRLDSLASTHAFVGVLEEFLESLHDFHLHLTTNTATSPWLVPSGADLRAEWNNDRAVITQVRPSSHAERAGLRAGMTVTSVDGLPVREAVLRRLRGGEATPRALAWGLQAVLAGYRSIARRITAVDRDGSGVDASIASGPVAKSDTALLDANMLPGGIGTIRPNNSLGDIALIAAFDGALDVLIEGRGLVLDLRDTPGGGNTTVARGILGRFIDREMPYQVHTLPGVMAAYGVERKWIEVVAPRGTQYRGAVVVIVDAWTGSMGEGIAIALDGMKRATVIGSPMAGLLGATEHVRLPNTDIGVNVPTERLFHVDGTPRESFEPVRVEPAGRGTDPALQRARELLGR